MNDFDYCRDPSGKVRSQVSALYENAIPPMPNLAAGYVRREFRLSLKIGKRDSVSQRARPWQIHREDGQMSQFLLDTGATASVICGELADAIGLSEGDDGEGISLPVALGKEGQVTRHNIWIKLGEKTIDTYCYVPHPRDPSKPNYRMKNLLGMDELLDNFLICISRSQMHAFPRKG